MTTKKATIGSIITFNNGIKGIVQKVNENSVIVAITENRTSHEYEGDRTVVNHRRYTIVS
ncbi:DUF2187 family protein [Domibacillus robiginosus]|uniref:DUF2187 family protein n=1 Tax=Domibacillus robiginosus TaxID=1071054 RepID=UPI00067A7E08|nr:DUF2187 family protein [Domibacillus robiginosus]